MPADNQVSATLTEAQVAEVLGHLAALNTLLPFLLSREPGDKAVMLGEKSQAFDAKCATYMASYPEFIPGYLKVAEVDKDRTLREQLAQIRPLVELFAAKVQDTYDVVGNELMMADLAYYASVGEADKRGVTSAGDIRADLATRYPGRGSTKPVPAPGK